MIYLLFILLLLISVLTFYLFKKEICSPAFIFCIPFLLMTFIAILNIKNWQLESFHANTLIIIITGIVSFVISAKFVSIIKLKSIKTNQSEKKELKKYKLCISIFIQVISLLLYVYYLKKWGLSQGVNSLTESIALTMERGKFGIGETLDLPYIVNSLIICSKAFGYIYVAIMAKKIANKDKSGYILLIVNTVISLLIHLLSGSRGTSLELIVAFAICFLFYYYKRNKSKKIKFKYIFSGIVSMICFLFLFFYIKEFQGRGTFDWNNTFSEFSIYIGAQIKNLDIYLNEATVHTKVFAFGTLSNFYSIFNSYLGANIKDSVDMLPFIVINGQSLGNVYTCFYNYYMDFGIFGVILFSSISGLISEYIYRKAKNSNNTILLVIYSYIGACLIFCFFGNRFFDNLLSAGFIRFLIWIFIDMVFIDKIYLFNNEKIISEVR